MHQHMHLVRSLRHLRPNASCIIANVLQSRQGMSTLHQKPGAWNSLSSNARPALSALISSIPPPSMSSVRLLPRHIRHLMTSAASNSGSGAPSSSAAAAAFNATSPADKPSESLGAKVKRVANEQFLPLSLIGTMIFASLFPAPGVWAAQMGASKLATIGIFILSGLALKGGHVIQALSSYGAFLYGVAAILLLTPLAGLLVLNLGIAPKELPLGLAVFSCMPTSLSSCVTLTLAVGGNSALALLLTLTTNVLGIFTLPFMLSFILQTSEGVDLPPGPMLRTLVEQILIPLFVGVGMRLSLPSLRGWIDANRKAVSMISTGFLVTVPWMQISQAAANKPDLGAFSLFATFCLGLGVHALYLLMNTGASSALRLGGSEGGSFMTQKVRRAVILTASQKTLPVAVVVCSKLAEQLGVASGIMVLPCVMSHLGQILMDSWLVSYWINQDRKAGLLDAKKAQ